MSDLRYNKETDRFERVESFPIEAMQAQILGWQGQIDNYNAEIAALGIKIADLQKLIDDRNQ